MVIVILWLHRSSLWIRNDCSGRRTRMLLLHNPTPKRESAQRAPLRRVAGHEIKCEGRRAADGPSMSFPSRCSRRETFAEL